MRWNLLRHIDRFICNYLGLKRSAVKPNAVRFAGNHLSISNTEPFRRHIIQQSWDQFAVNELAGMNHEHKMKLGLAAGKALAKNLVISFEETIIKKP